MNAHPERTSIAEVLSDIHQKYKFGCEWRNLTKPQTRGDNNFSLVQAKLIREIGHKIAHSKWASQLCRWPTKLSVKPASPGLRRVWSKSTIMMNHPGRFQARAKHCVCAHSSCVTLQNPLKKHMEEQDSQHSVRAGNNYETIQSPQKNLQNHVRFWILQKCES